jgi:hypothetical protein
LDRMLRVGLAHGVQHVQKRAQIQNLRRVHGSQLFSRLETDGSLVVLLQPCLQQVENNWRLVAVSVPMPSPQNSHPIPSQVGAQSCGDRSGVTGLAKCGWLVEVRLRPERKPDPRFFAVGTLEAGDAEEAILRYPGIVREDKRTAQRPLSDQEIACLRLRVDSVRPYILCPPRV